MSKKMTEITENSCGIIPYKVEFEEFCRENGIGEDSSSSYSAYVTGAYNHLCPLVKFNYNGKEYDSQVLFENLDYIYCKNDTGRDLIIFLLDILANDINAETCSKSYVSKMRTALRWYMAFVINEAEFDNKSCKKDSDTLMTFNKFVKDVSASILTELRSQYPNTKIIFTQADLIKIFTIRILTQDRVKGQYAIKLPVRKIAGELSFHHKKDKSISTLSQFVKDFIVREGKVKFIISADGEQTVDLGNVRALQINNDVVTIQTKSKDKAVVYTELYDNGYCTFDALAKKNRKSTEISKLALDHDNPIFNILQDKVSALHGLKRFNDFLENEKEGKNHHLKFEEAKMLFDDFKEIHDAVEFTIMDQTENIKKGKKP